MSPPAARASAALLALLALGCAAPRAEDGTPPPRTRIPRASVDALVEQLAHEVARTPAERWPAHIALAGGSPPRPRLAEVVVLDRSGAPLDLVALGDELWRSLQARPALDLSGASLRSSGPPSPSGDEWPPPAAAAPALAIHAWITRPPGAAGEGPPELLLTLDLHDRVTRGQLLRVQGRVPLE